MASRARVAGARHTRETVPCHVVKYNCPGRRQAVSRIGVSRGQTCLLGHVQGQHDPIRNWPVVPKPVLSQRPGPGSEVRGRRPGFLHVSVHGLGEPLTVLSQQVCRGRGQCQSRCARPPAAGQNPPSGWAPCRPLPPRHRALPWSHSHRGLLLQAASTASRQSACSATRARRRLSVLGCSLRAGCGAWTSCRP